MKKKSERKYHSFLGSTQKIKEEKMEESLGLGKKSYSNEPIPKFDLVFGC